MKGGFLLVANQSLPKMLSNVFSEYNWDFQKFENQGNIWNDLELAKYFIDWLKTQNDSEISLICQFVKENGEQRDVLTQNLKIAFPKKWLESPFSNTKKSQYLLKECIKTIFNKENTLVFEEYSHPDAENLELDYFLPEFNLAFEYQVKRLYSRR